MRTRSITALSVGVLTAVLFTGCDVSSFETTCKEKGGVVEKDRESCKIKSGSRKGKAGTRTEKECIDEDGREIDEYEGLCS